MGIYYTFYIKHCMLFMGNPVCSRWQSEASVQINPHIKLTNMQIPSCDFLHPSPTDDLSQAHIFPSFAHRAKLTRLEPNSFFSFLPLSQAHMFSIFRPQTTSTKLRFFRPSPRDDLNQAQIFSIFRPQTTSTKLTFFHPSPRDDLNQAQIFSILRLETAWTKLRYFPSLA